MKTLPCFLYGILKECKALGGIERPLAEIRWFCIHQTEMLVTQGKKGKDTATSAGNREVPRVVVDCGTGSSRGACLSFHLITTLSEVIEICSLR